MQKELVSVESRNQTLASSIDESKSIAEEVENAARQYAAGIMEQTLVIVDTRARQIAALDREKAVLENELEQCLLVHSGASDSPDAVDSNVNLNLHTNNPAILPSLMNQCILDSISEQPAAAILAPPINTLHTISGFKNLGRGHKQENDSLISKNELAFPVSMKVVAFLNAKHYMVFANKQGKVHGHSWQFQAEAEVPVHDESFVKFEDLDKTLNRLLAPYQKMVLNEIPPFDIIEPLTENIAAYIFNRLFEELSNLGVHLVRLNVWENPTKGIEITQVMEQFFTTLEAAPIPAAAVRESIREFNSRDKHENQIKTINPDNKVLTQDNSFFEQRQEKIRYEQKENTIKLLEPESTQPLNLETINENKIQHTFVCWQIILAIIIILGVGIWAYWPILSAPLDSKYPWGSDSWAHALKAEFYYKQLLNGNYYPQFMPFWQNGVQPYRYWAPLPWALMALMNIFINNIFVTINLFILICAVLGGISWLIFIRKIGFWPSVMSGIIWVFWLDNLRISFSDSNYTRMLTIALLPLLMGIFFQTIEKEKYIKPLFGTILLIIVMVHCHAMMAAIYCVSLMMIAIIWWMVGGISFKGIIRGGTALVAGILASSWWLLPSLKGGLIGMGGEANAANIEYLSPLKVFNPLNVRSEYLGLSLIIAVIFFILTWKHRPSWAKCLVIFGVFVLMLNFPWFKTIQELMPLGNILWPIRFSTIWSLAIIISIFAYKKGVNYINFYKFRISISILGAIFFIIFISDSFFSLKDLAITTKEPFYILQTVESLNQHPGWRVATLDLCGLGSAPSYYLSIKANREQVYGWGWQGAQTAQNIMLINMAQEFNWYDYIFDRLIYLGTSDILVKNETVKNIKVFNKLALDSGYQKINDFGPVSHWHKEIKPYLVQKKYECLAIGKHASIYAIQFPEIEISQTTKIDDYSLEQLSKYKMLILAGSSWNAQAQAEKLIVQYAQSGGKVLVDLTGFEPDVLARQPKFLGIYGEPISAKDNLEIYSENEKIILEPFDGNDWRCIAPQGLDGSIYQFSHYGNEAVLLGYKKINSSQRIYFLGANLAYHSFITHDPNAMKILNRVLHPQIYYKKPQVYLLKNYSYNSNGYNMSYYTNETTPVIVPIAALEGMKVKLDDKPKSMSITENLPTIVIPSGTHKIEFYLEKAPVFIAGRWITVICILIIIGGLILTFYRRIKADRNEMQISTTNI